MAKYVFTAMDAQGNEVSGDVEADGKNAVFAALKEQGLFPTSVEDAAAAKKKGRAPAAPKKRTAAPKAKGKGLNAEIKLPSLVFRVKAKELMVFTRQLATLINAGLPLLRSLRVLVKQEKNPLLKRAINDMAETIESGSTFAEALAQHPKIFNKLFINMVKAGEVGGVLDVVLVRLAEFMEKAQRIKSKVVSAMVYPVVVMVMALGILIFLLVVIVPRFQEIFKDLLEGAPMPALTEAVLSVSEVISSQLWLVALIVAGLVIAIKLLRKTTGGALLVDRMKLRAPVFGKLVQLTAISRFTRTLGTLMSSGVPVLQALLIVRETVGNEIIARSVGEIHDSVKEGENMAPTIENSKQFPPMVVSMVEVGEETGALPEMLMKIADTYDEDVDNAVAGMTSVIEPILIIFLALIVGSIVIALFLPLISIIGKLGGQ